VLPTSRVLFCRARFFVAVPLIFALQACAFPTASPPVTQTASAAAAESVEAPAGSPAYRVEIRRTALGIPHLQADDWGSLGYGYGYVQAQDNLCTMADGFVSYRGERSRYFGADAKPSTESTFGQPSNLDADFFFRFIDDDTAVARYRSSQTGEMRALVDGFVNGYNRYVDALAHGDFPRAHAACRNAPWAGKIDTSDVYRRLYAANLADGAARFVNEIANAQPPAPGSATTPGRPEQRQPKAAGTPLPSPATPLAQFGGHDGIGSNALAFGADATRTDSGLLFGNPHWFWSGPDRFYQAHLTIPGTLDVSGVSFLGVPVIMLGFNRDIAWTHTVSSSAHFGVFQMKLVPGAPTSYEYDGKAEAMTPTSVSVDVRDADGALRTVTRTLYRSRFGPLIDLGTMSPTLAWNAQQAFALRDVNADNFRVFKNFLEGGQARSLDAFIEIQKKNVALPWVNTLAIGRADPRAWFADIGAIPNVPDALKQACTTPAGKALGDAMRGIPFLDGARSACEWRVAHDAAQPGALPAAHMPSLARRDYVGNFNDSFWLAQPAAPLGGFAAVVGATGTTQSLRTRLGHRIAAQLQTNPAGVSSDALKQAALDSRSLSAALFKQPVRARLCDAAPADDLREACATLAAWDDTGNADARGATLWDAFWAHLSAIPAAQLYAVPFDPSQPLTTPSGLAADRGTLVTAMRAAIADLQRDGLAVDARRSAALYVQRDGERIALSGGCGQSGYFTVVCPLDSLATGADSTNVNLHGNSYLQIVSFGAGDADNVIAHTLLASSESDDPASPHYTDGTRDYAARHWRRFPFAAADIAADPQLTRVVLSAPATMTAAP
jgi:acyl-homoserine-lactone acylase